MFSVPNVKENKISFNLTVKFRFFSFLSFFLFFKLGTKFILFQVQTVKKKKMDKNISSLNMYHSYVQALNC